MFVGDICEESKASNEDDTPRFIHTNVIYSQLSHFCL